MTYKLKSKEQGKVFQAEVIRYVGPLSGRHSACKETRGPVWQKSCESGVGARGEADKEWRAF